MRELEHHLLGKNGLVWQPGGEVGKAETENYLVTLWRRWNTKSLIIFTTTNDDDDDLRTFCASFKMGI